jgi:hypothetical protein
MLQDKDTKNLSELKSVFVDSHKNPFYFTKIIDLLKLGKYHALFSSVKKKGVSALLLIRIILTFPFIGEKNIYGFTKSTWAKYTNFGKDTFYRLMRNPLIKWRSFLLAVANSTINVLSKRKEESNNIKANLIKAFIFDDTPTEKTGEHIEGVSKIWNHIIQKHIFGYQLLVMGFYTGTFFIPLNFSFHREKGKNKSKPFGLKKSKLQKQFSKKRVAGTAGAKRKNELDMTKIASVVQMLKLALKRGFQADYVLTDSWYTCWETVKTALDNGLNYIGMYSKVKTKFKFNNKYLSYKQIQRKKG